MLSAFQANRAPLNGAMSAAPHRFAFPALLGGNLALAFGPLMVRLSDVAPVASAFWRLALAFVPILVIARLMARPAAMAVPGQPRRILWLGAFAGFAFAADLAVWHLGILRTTLANAALLSNAASFLLPIWGIVALGHRPTRPALAAIGLALLGTLLLVGQSAEVGARNLAGDVFCLVAALLYTAYLILVDRLRGSVGAFPILAMATGFGAAALLPVALLASPGAFWPGDWTPLLLLALGSQVIGQGLIVFAVGHLRPLVVGLAFLTQPVIAAAIGSVRFGEVPGPVELAGALLVLVALVLVRLPAGKPAPPVDGP